MNEMQKIRLKTLLTDNEANFAEHEFWFARLASAPREVCEEILSIFECMPSEVQWLYAIQRKKEIAIAEGSRSAWEDVIEEEHAHLLSFLNKK